MSVHAGWPVGRAVGWTGDGWARMADADWGAALRPWRGPIVVRWGEAQEELDEVPALDRPVRIPSTGRTITLRALFAALRANGVVPHAHGEDGGDEVAAEEILGALESGDPAADETEAGVPPTPFMGLAHGDYPRTAPASPEGKEKVADAPESFQAITISQTGTYAQMLADVAMMGGGRIRRAQQCEGHYACVFPYDETQGGFHNFGSEVPPPAEMLEKMREGSFGRLAATTSLVVACLVRGVKFDLAVFNGGGGMQQNHTPQDTGSAGGG